MKCFRLRCYVNNSFLVFHQGTKHSKTIKHSRFALVFHTVFSCLDPLMKHSNSLFTYNMKLNASKTKEMRVNFSSSSLSYPPIVINNQTVNIVTHAKLLGVTISNDLKWNLHENAICKKASKRLYALRLAVEKKRPSELRPGQDLSRVC